MIENLIIYFLIPFIKIGAIVLILSGAIAYLTLLERKLIAHIQVRLGPMRVGWHGLLQPIADGLKFVLKEDIVPSKADALIFTLAPMISLIPAFVVFAVVPFGPPDMFEGLLGGILSWFLEPVSVDRVVQNSMASGGFVTDINIAVLFVTHKLDECYRIGGQAIIFRDGESVAQGPLEARAQGRDPIPSGTAGWRRIERSHLVITPLQPQVEDRLQLPR